MKNKTFFLLLCANKHVEILLTINLSLFIFSNFIILN